MKITEIDVWTVVVPVFPEAVHSEEYGGYPDWARVPKQIIRMHTDEGITGIGETGRGQLTEAVAQAGGTVKGQGCDEDVFAERLSFRALKPNPESPEDWEIDPGPYPTGYEAFEMAVFDLIGKRLDVPVHTLLGGACRDKVRADFWIGPSDTGAYRTQYKNCH